MLEPRSTATRTAARVEAHSMSWAPATGPRSHPTVRAEQRPSRRGRVGVPAATPLLMRLREAAGHGLDIEQVLEEILKEEGRVPVDRDPAPRAPGLSRRAAGGGAGGARTHDPGIMRTEPQNPCATTPRGGRAVSLSTRIPLC